MARVGGRRVEIPPQWNNSLVKRIMGIVSMGKLTKHIQARKKPKSARLFRLFYGKLVSVDLACK